MIFRLFIASASPHRSSLEKGSPVFLSQNVDDNEAAESGGLGVQNRRDAGRVSFAPQQHESETTEEDKTRNALRRLALAQVHLMK